MAATTGSTYISESITDMIKISTANLRFELAEVENLRFVAGILLISVILSEI